MRNNAITDLRELSQKYYGGYCIKARERGKHPLPYHHFQKLFGMLNVPPKEAVNIILSRMDI